MTELTKQDAKPGTRVILNGDVADSSGRIRARAGMIGTILKVPIDDELMCALVTVKFDARHYPVHDLPVYCLASLEGNNAKEEHHDQHSNC